MKGKENVTANDLHLTAKTHLRRHMGPEEDTVPNLQITVQHLPAQLVRHGTPRTVPDHRHHQVPTNHATTKLQVTDQAHMHRVTANHQVTDSHSNSQVTVDHHRVRKLALTVKDRSEKTKTFAHTAIKGYKQSAVKCQVLLPNRSRLTGVRFFFPFSHAFFAISSIWITYY